MTLAELSRLSKGQFSGLLSSVTVGDVISASSAGDVRTSKKTNGAHKEEASGGVNTRTAAGRREYDGRVFEYIQSAEEPVSATEIRTNVGGTSLQVRKSVARLIEAERVTWHGKARGTRYSVL